MPDLVVRLQSFLIAHPWPILAVSVTVCLALWLPLTGVETALLCLAPVALGWWGTGLMAGQLGMGPVAMDSLWMYPAVGIACGYSFVLLNAELAPFRGLPARLPTTTGSLVMLGAMVAVGTLADGWPPVQPGGEGAMVMAVMGLSAIVARVLMPAMVKVLARLSDCGGTPRFYHLLGGIWCLGYLLLIHFILLAGLVPVAVLIHPRDRVRRARWLRGIARPGLAGLVYTFPYGRVVCGKASRAALAKPSIIVSNHQSIVDIPLLFRMPCDFRLTIKGQWWVHPLIGAGVKALRYVRVDQGDPEAVLRQCTEAYREGSSIHFFPQGTRSRSDVPLRFHKGAFELAVQLNADITPVALCDTWTCLPRGGIWVERFRMRMKVLPRVTPSTFDYGLGAKALGKHVETIISQAWIDELDRNNTPDILRRKVERLYRYQGCRVEREVVARLRDDPELAGMAAWVPRQGLILDLGCGYGVVSHWLAQSGPARKILGLDCDAARIRVARCSAPDSQQVRFAVGDGCRDPLPDCAAVLLLDVIEPELNEPDEALLIRIRDALAPGGRLLLRYRHESVSGGADRLRKLGFEVLAQVGRTWVAARPSEGPHGVLVPATE